MNKQEAIEEIEKEKSPFNAWEDLTRNHAFDDALTIVRKIDELEKPVVPQFVADMIVKRKKQGDSLVGTLVNLGAFGDAQRWIRKGDNGDTFAKAWLFGYEVEKEKLYTVEIPNPNGGEYSRTYLGKYASGKVGLYNWTGYTHIAYADDWKKEGKSQLTEAEIKQDFDWAWQFAEEVEE